MDVNGSDVDGASIGIRGVRIADVGVRSWGVSVCEVRVSVLMACFYRCGWFGRFRGSCKAFRCGLCKRPWGGRK